MHARGPVRKPSNPRRLPRGAVRARLLVFLALSISAAVVGAGCSGLGPGRSAWAFSMVQVSALSAQGYNGAGVTVAIIDSGVDLGHGALTGLKLLFWEDLVNGRGSPYDDNGHGTAMVSIMAGRGALAGGAPGVALIVIKAIAADGSGTDQTIASAISDAASHGADIISLSLGGGGAKLVQVLGSASVQAAESAASLGVLVVGSAGNDGENDDGQVSIPSVAKDAISVGAVDASMKIAPFSSAGKKVPLQGDPDLKPEVVAPGVDIAVAWLNGQTVSVSGTSPAAVFVSAGLALLLQMKPAYKRAGASGVDAVKTALMQSALKVAGQATPHDAHYGYGVFQAQSAASRLA